MSKDLDLSVPKRTPDGKEVKSGPSRVWTAVLLGLMAANLAVTLWKPGRSAAPAAPNRLSQDEHMQLALKLEKQDLHEAAADAWRDYLEEGDVAPERAAKVWYRIGALHEEADAYERALEAYYRSERFAAVPELADEINRRTQRCLEALGKYAALRYELAERVGVGSSSNAPGDTVVAEIGPRKVNRAELDRMIESQIERQLASAASFLSPEERGRQKERMLKEASGASQRLQFLNQFILQETLSRKARESGVSEDPEVRALLEAQERALLAARMIEQAYEERIHITPGDVETYYEAHREAFRRPERVRVSHMMFTDGAAASNALAKAVAGEAFEDLAAARSEDGATRERGGEMEGWVEKGGPVRGFGLSPEANELIFETEAGQVVPSVVKGREGYHVIKVLERAAGRLPPLEEVRPRVYRELRARKEREVQEGLLAELYDRYRVVIHRSEFDVGSGPGEPDSP